MTNRLVLGTAQLGMLYGIRNKTGQPSIDKSREIIQAAWDRGIRYFDTARSYGEAESILGKIFRDLKISDKASVISKVSGELDKIDERVILNGIDKSIKTLNIKGLYGFFLHDPLNLDSWGTKAARIVRTIRKNNLAKKIGISVYSYKDALRALDIDDFDIVQMPFNIFDQAYYLKDIYREAERRNKTIFIRSIFLQGLLLMSLGELSENHRDFAGYLKKRDELCVKFGLSNEELAIGYVKNRAKNAYIIFGAENPLQICETVRIFEECDIDEAVVREIEERLSISDEKVINPSKWSN